MSPAYSGLIVGENASNGRSPLLPLTGEVLAEARDPSFPGNWSRMSGNTSGMWNSDNLLSRTPDSADKGPLPEVPSEPAVPAIERSLEALLG